MGPRGSGNGQRQTCGQAAWGRHPGALLLPTGLLTAAFLTHRPGLEGYGLFILVASLIAWIEGSITAMFARATFKFIAEAEDWCPVGAAAVQVSGCERRHNAAALTPGLAYRNVA